MHEPDATLALWDYRRRVADAYAAVRAHGGGFEAWNRWRTFRDDLFRTHPQSPLADREGFTGLSYFPYDPSWRLEVEVVPLDDGPEVLSHSGTGATGFRRFGSVDIHAGEAVSRLTLYWLEGYGGGVFLPFRDATNGGTTYGGGRYLLDTVKGADLGHRGRRLLLDFNFAYHPSCVHDSRWSCPLPPQGNRIESVVEAGERL